MRWWRMVTEQKEKRNKSADLKKAEMGEEIMNHAIGVEPLYGNRSGKVGKTHWMVFMKIKEGNNDETDH